MTLSDLSHGATVTSRRRDRVLTHGRGCLHALTAPGPGPWRTWLEVNGLDEATLALLSEHNLQYYLFYRLQEVGLPGGLPQEQVARLLSAYVYSVASAEKRLIEHARVLRVLRQAGIVPVVFKGAALASTAYPDPACRPMDDLDLWVLPEELVRASATLQAAGYAAPAGTERSPAWLASQRGEVQLFAPPPDRYLVELHASPFAGEWLCRATAIDEAGIRSRVVPIAIAGERCLTLAPEDALIQLATHFAINHQFAFIWLRALLDIVLLARSSPLDWEAVTEHARSWRVATVIATVLELANDLFGLEEAGRAQAKLAPGSIRRRLLKLFVSPEAIVFRRDLRAYPLRRVVQLLLVDRPQDGVRLIWRGLWPEDEWLAERYGQSGQRSRREYLSSMLRARP